MPHCNIILREMTNAGSMKFSMTLSKVCSTKCLLQCHRIRK